MIEFQKVREKEKAEKETVKNLFKSRHNLLNKKFITEGIILK